MAKDQTGDEVHKYFSPSDFMRARRPENYSDSSIVKKNTLKQAQLDFHLDTLTSRSQEKDFEHFAKGLAEKEVCPNLIPQTGPTGGGDSKVDTETFPVSEKITERWYEGSPSAGDERWAFSVSAKKDWRPKVKSDIKKIIKTKRGYSKIFSITNQYVSDKKRADLEDELTKLYSTPIRIFDRSWIIDRVLNHGHEELAISLLNIDGCEASIKSIGSKDVDRQAELKDLDTQISDQDRYNNIEYQLVSDCLRSAILARELDHPRHEIEGRFARAKNMALKYGTQYQLLKISYQQAWTACFYYDDISEFNIYYSEVEKYALESDSAFHTEKLVTLWHVLVGSSALASDSDIQLDIRVRGERLKNKLQVFTAQKHRPNNALHAETSLVLVEIYYSIRESEKERALDKNFLKLKNILVRSSGLGDYPFDRYETIITELGALAPDSNAYDLLFEELLIQSQKRNSDGSQGVLLIERGIQKLKSEDKYEAIRFFGRAQEKLIQYDYREDLVRALLGCSIAYKQAGLLWAARSSALAAAAKALAEFNENGEIIGPVLACFERLLWIEVKLGRLPHILFCFKTIEFLVRQLELDVEYFYTKILDRGNFDGILSLLMLRANDTQVKTFTKLPYVFDQFQLVGGELVTLYMLGQKEKLITKGFFESEQNLEEFFALMPSQPANEDLPNKLELMEEDQIWLTSRVLGCKLVFEVENKFTSILVAESILGAIEAFLATSLSLDLFPYKPEAMIKIHSSNINQSELGLSINMGDSDYLGIVSHANDFSMDSIDRKRGFQKFILEFIGTILPRIAICSDFSALFERLEKEEAFSRSLSFADTLTLTDIVLGGDKWFRLSDWTSTIENECSPYKRRGPWNWIAPIANDKLKRNKVTRDYKNRQGFKHDELSVVSIIDLPLWDAAKWNGFCYINKGGMLGIGLAFTDANAAKSIFDGWHKTIGQEDKNDKIRISIIRGIDKDNPDHYKVCISSNIDVNDITDKYLMMASRIHTMTPDTPQNLDMLIHLYKDSSFYHLMPVVNLFAAIQPDILFDKAIKKRQLIIKDAWEIGLTDPEVVAISSSDNPIIPSNVKNAPVLSVLAKKKR